MGDGVSLSELARQLGRAKSGLHKLAKAKQIPQLGDGTFDVEAVRKSLEKNLDPARSAGQKPVHEAVHRSPASERRPTTTGPALPRTEDEAKFALALIRRVLEAEGFEVDQIDFNAARTADTILKAYQRDLAMAQQRKELVPLVQQQKHTSDAIVAIRQIWQRMPSRHGAAMARLSTRSRSAAETPSSAAIAADLDEMSKVTTKGQP
jgi:hypothetical protein